MNQVVLIGNLARDPELRYTNTGKAVANFTVAVNRGYGKDQNEADFINVVVWEKQAENCANYLAKGRKVAVQGRLRTSSYETQNGERRYKTEVHANVVEFLGGTGAGESQPSRPSQPSQPTRSSASSQGTSDDGFNPDDIDLKEFETMEEDDDLPF